MNRKQVLRDMKKNKKNEKVIDEDTNAVVSRFIFTVGGIIIVLILSYLIIGIFVNKTISFKNKKEDKKEEVKIDNTTILAGTIFDQKEDEYYVLVYDVSDEKNILSSWKSLYSGKDKSLTVYVVDSSKKLNARYIVEKGSNSNPTSYSDLKIVSPTLIKINNKKVTEYIEGEEAIKKAFNK